MRGLPPERSSGGAAFLGRGLLVEPAFAGVLVFVFVLAVAGEGRGLLTRDVPFALAFGLSADGRVAIGLLQLGWIRFS